MIIVIVRHRTVAGKKNSIDGQLNCEKNNKTASASHSAHIHTHALCIVMTMTQSEHTVRMRLFRLNSCCFHSKKKRKQNIFQLRFKKWPAQYFENKTAAQWIAFQNGNKRDIVLPRVRVLLQNAMKMKIINDQIVHYRQHLFSNFLSFLPFLQTIHHRLSPSFSCSQTTHTHIHSRIRVC